MKARLQIMDKVVPHGLSQIGGYLLFKLASLKGCRLRISDGEGTSSEDRTHSRKEG